MPHIPEEQVLGYDVYCRRVQKHLVVIQEQNILRLLGHFIIWEGLPMRLFDCYRTSIFSASYTTGFWNENFKRRIFKVLWGFTGTITAASGIRVVQHLKHCHVLDLFDHF